MRPGERSPHAACHTVEVQFTSVVEVVWIGRVQMEEARVEVTATLAFPLPRRGDRARSRSITFVSTCPACGSQRSQNGYTRRAIARLLETNHTIDAYCVPCDVLWPIGADERRAMARVIASTEDHAP